MSGPSQPTHDQVLARRLAAQRLTGPPAATPVQVVGELLSVQAQDPLLARAMVGYRCDADATAVQRAVAAGEIVRTHVLRPTWHYVSASDLRWLLDLTSTRVESSMAARHRQLGVDESLLERAHEVFAARLAGRSYAARPALGEALTEAGVVVAGHPLFGQQVGHLLLVAELRAWICSAPVAGTEHHYALVDEVVPPAAPLEREVAVEQLVHRFVAGHGPVAVGDLQRWTPLPVREIRPALAALAADGEVTMTELEGAELWHVADEPTATRPQRAWLLSTFDEAFLSYRTLGFPASRGNPLAGYTRRFAEAGGGPVLCDLRDVGGWKRRTRAGSSTIELDLDPGLGRRQRSEVDLAVDRLLAAL